MVQALREPQEEREKVQSYFTESLTDGPDLTQHLISSPNLLFISSVPYFGGFMK